MAKNFLSNNIVNINVKQDTVYVKDNLKFDYKVSTGGSEVTEFSKNDSADFSHSFELPENLQLTDTAMYKTYNISVTPKWTVNSKTSSGNTNTEDINVYQYPGLKLIAPKGEKSVKRWTPISDSEIETFPDAVKTILSKKPTFDIEIDPKYKNMDTTHQYYPDIELNNSQLKFKDQSIPQLTSEGLSMPVYINDIIGSGDNDIIIKLFNDDTVYDYIPGSVFDVTNAVVSTTVSGSYIQNTEYTLNITEGTVTQPFIMDRFPGFECRTYPTNASTMYGFQYDGLTGKFKFTKTFTSSTPVYIMISCDKGLRYVKINECLAENLPLTFGTSTVNANNSTPADVNSGSSFSFKIENANASTAATITKSGNIQSASMTQATGVDLEGVVTFGNTIGEGSITVKINGVDYTYNFITKNIEIDIPEDEPTIDTSTPTPTTTTTTEAPTE